jgi:hypothetical protein
MQELHDESFLPRDKTRKTSWQSQPLRFIIFSKIFFPPLPPCLTFLLPPRAANMKRVSYRPSLSCIAPSSHLPPSRADMLSLARPDEVCGEHDAPPTRRYSSFLCRMTESAGPEHLSGRPFPLSLDCPTVLPDRQQAKQRQHKTLAKGVPETAWAFR